MSGISKIESKAGWLYAFVAAAALIIVLLTAWPSSLDLWPARLLLASLWFVGLSLLFLSKSPSLLISPLIILGLLCSFFYAFLPALAEYTSNFFFSLFGGITLVSFEHLNGPAERLIIIFSSLLLIALCIFAAVYQKKKLIAKNTRKLRLLPGLRYFLVFLALTSIFLWSNWPSITSGLGQPLTDKWLFSQIRHVLPPVYTISIAFLFFDAIGRGRLEFFSVLALIILSLIILGLAGQLKIPLYFAATLLFCWVGFSALKLSYRLVVAGSVLVLLFALLATLSQFDLPSFSSLKKIETIPKSLTYSLWNKTITRQTATISCLDSVIDNHWPNKADGNPFYFLQGLIPRILWKDKPNLSRGRYYAERYCGSAPAGLHSASLTLLGEPISRAGATGLITAIITLITIFSVITFLAERTTPYGATVLIAIQPWLMDFDQHFALYLANAVKMGLVVLAILMFVIWVQHKQLNREPLPLQHGKNY